MDTFPMTPDSTEERRSTARWKQAGAVHEVGEGEERDLSRYLLAEVAGTVRAMPVQARYRAGREQLPANSAAATTASSFRPPTCQVRLKYLIPHSPAPTWYFGQG
ncbi:hypothetical protein CKAH01_00964 [Colletotrichum kahawae]|uniref:Uncharacterized protein n=1 Tax=Colletotrichum kahawae TaxID=34407 RepID=A0AAE0D9A7_COLKA|nr:hypothetical protein CKAH01_00964 [Colletotrichum kahawae]